MILHIFQIYKLMAFDFFNEGLKPQAKIEFTKQEDEFFNSKLSFLDPKKTSAIPIGTAISLFQLSQINSTNTKKIIQNCKLQGKKAITYEQMKKAFRGIALVQKGIEPSAININANIKLPMPKFYDDDDDDEEQPQQKLAPQIQKEKSLPKQPPVQQPPQPKVVATIKQAPFAQFGDFGQFTQKVEQRPPPPQQAPQAQVVQQKVQKQGQKGQNSQLGSKLKQFQAYWGKLNTHNNKIDGGQVKSLCKNLAQRSNLSKAWKICCQTHSGSLTKGQFYVFLQMVGLPQLPEALTEEMKTIISKIDKPGQQAKQASKTQPQTMPNPMGSTQMFQNFGKSELSMTSAQTSNKPPTQPLGPRSSQNLAVTEIGKKVSAKLESQTQILQAAQQANEQELLQFRRQQQTMNNLMGEVQQYLLQVNNRNNKIRSEIDELKTNQTNLNDRFNKVCMAMNQIIQRQNGIIEELMVEMSNQNAANQQKMAVLEAYVVERTKHCEQVEQAYRAHLRKTASHEQPKSQTKNSITQENNHVNPFHQQEPESPKYQKRQPQIKEKQSPPVSQEEIPNPKQSPKVEQPQQEQKQAEGQLSQQQIEYINRMKMKQMQVIQLINYLTPISPDQYPKIAQKITAYSEEQLNYAYTGLYQKLMQKKKQQQMMAEKQKEEKERPSDEFNTTNFKNEEQTQNGQGQDFFG